MNDFCVNYLYSYDGEAKSPEAHPAKASENPTISLDIVCLVNREWFLCELFVFL